MKLIEFGKWALGMYPPSTPEDLRITDTISTPGVEFTQIHSTPEIPKERKARLISRQARQHQRRNEALEVLGYLELQDIEDLKRTESDHG